MPALRSSRSWISPSGSAFASAPSSSTSTRSGTGSPRCRASSPAMQLRDERLPAVPRAEQLHDVQPVVVGLDERGHRAALAQRRHVPGGDDGPEHGASVGAGPSCAPSRSGVSLLVQLHDVARAPGDPWTTRIRRGPRPGAPHRHHDDRPPHRHASPDRDRVPQPGRPDRDQRHPVPRAHARLDLQPRGGSAHHGPPQGADRARRPGRDGTRDHRSRRATGDA